MRAPRPGRTLTDEDRILWNIVARTAKPLRPPRRDAEEERADTMPDLAETAIGPPAKPSPTSASPALAKPAPRPPAHSLDRPTRAKIARGRLPIEGRVDLHGLFQDQAHALLLSFLRQAHAGGARHVLVITGKGSSSGGDGVLRRSVPAWFSTVPFRGLVSGFDAAAREHGGEGALYVRLKRRTG